MIGDRWSDGRLENENGVCFAEVQNGIPFFVQPEDDGWGTDEQVDLLLTRHGVKRETLIPQNWEASLRNWGPSSKQYEWVQRIVKQGGRILEIACGPGGGFLPLILDLDPKAQLLANDIGGWILVEWKKFNDKKGLWANASFAQFDVNQCPLRSDCFDCVDSAGGFSNIEKNHLALAEIYRVLKPGGRLFMSDADADPSSFEQLPDAEQEAWLKRFPQQGKGYEETVLETGFEILQMEQTGKTPLQPHESVLAEMTTKYGITMYLRGYHIEARKPA
jgi:ubiquinone/menaquinone biosynthesis C-methylase UbiE